MPRKHKNAVRMPLPAWAESDLKIQRRLDELSTLVDVLIWELYENEDRDKPQVEYRLMPIDPDYLTVETAAKVVDKEETTVRYWIQNNTDGFYKKCVIRRGRSIFIDRAQLLDWLDDGRVKYTG